MNKEKILIPESREREEQTKEVQRLELDPDEGIDIVIKKFPDKYSLREGKNFFAQVILEKDGKIIEDFKEEVPGTSFYFKERWFKKEKNPWGYIHDFGISMPKKWKSSKDLLVFVHELGHRLRHLRNSEEIEQLKELLDQEEEIGVQLHNIEKRGMVWHREKPGEAPDLKSVTEEDRGYFTNKLKEIKQKILHLKAGDERGSWAEGLNLIRKLKREKGIDLIKPFRGKDPEETRKNIEAFVHGFFLANYEESLREEIEERKLSEELKGVFTKKYREENNKK